MKKLIIGLTLICLLILSCATVSKASPNYVETGMRMDSLIGNRYYFATGMVNSYLLGFIATTSREYGVAIEVDASTGVVKRIATLQPAGRATASIFGSSGDSYVVYGGMRYKIGNLVGGISISDILPTDTWADAVQKAAAFDSLLN